ncbi:MAG: hypothetical protein AAFQ68_14765, partial [Bacteroidota bacterium]
EESVLFPRWLSAELGQRQHYLQLLGRVLLADFPNAPERPDVWRSLYPDKPFDDARLRKLTRDLTSWVEDFFAIEEFRSQKGKTNIALLGALQDRNLGELFEKEVRKLDKELSTQATRDASFFQQRYELEREVVEYQLSHGRSVSRPTQTKIGKENANALYTYFDLWWIQTKLELATRSQSRKQITGQQTDSILLAELLALIPQHDQLRTEPLLNLYREMTLLLRKDPSVSLDKLLGQIKQMVNLTNRDRQTLWVLLINHHVRRLNLSGDIQYAEKVLRLFEWAIEAGFLLIDGYLPEVYYKNLIAASLRAQQFEKAWRYLDQYQRLLREDRREDVYLLNLAIYHSAKKEYAKVIQTLNNVRMNNAREEIQARTLHLQAFYEVNPQEVEWLLSQTKNLERYIRSRSNMSDSNKKPFLNRLRLFRALLQADTIQSLDKLQMRIDTTKPLNTPEWLREKVDQKRENAI